MASDVVAAGGPNVVPPDDPWLAQCVARAPGSPMHVLLDDRIAEHIPGCNCAFRREALLAIGGFDPAFLRAGDDVDVCWRLQARGWTIGFAASALVWHRHRASVRAYLRQQVGYGEGETWLMRAHPEKFARGRAAWRGHIYSPLPFIQSMSATRINSGPFGSAAFPSVWRTCAHPLAYLPQSGRWQVAWMLLFALAAVTAALRVPYAPAALLAAGSIGLTTTIVKCLVSGRRSHLAGLPPLGRLPGWLSRAVHRLTIAALHFLQPFARLYGRVRGAVSRPAVTQFFVRRRVVSFADAAPVGLARGARLLLSGTVEQAFWSPTWIDVHTLLLAVADRLRRQRAVKDIALDSGWWEDRDLSIADRAWFRLDLRALVEDHGLSGSVCRLDMRARVTPAAVVPLLAALATAVLLHHVGGVAWIRGAVVVSVITLAMAMARIAAASRIAAAALEAVATESGMLTLTAADVRAWRAGQDDAPGRGAPRAFPEGAPSLPPPVLKVLPPRLTTAPRVDTPGAAVSRTLTGEL
jgi:hypothetical protein